MGANSTESQERVKATAEAIALILKKVSLCEAVGAVSLAMNTAFTAKYGYVARVSLYGTAFFPDAKRKE
ncbi:hypothetical protein [Oleidesulfovibrio sp.]|uniref:hypothetical protein n=1 Tax=Oleidesulfovibrio sp. TaxID=2909707 RepID=UPI003A85DF44